MITFSLIPVHAGEDVERYFCAYQDESSKKRAAGVAPVVPDGADGLNGQLPEAAAAWGPAPVEPQLTPGDGGLGGRTLGGRA